MDYEPSIPPAGKWPRLFWPRWVILAIALAVGLGGGWLTGANHRQQWAALVMAAATYGVFMFLAMAGLDTLEHIHPVFGPWTATLAAAITMSVGRAVGMADIRPLPVAVAAAVGVVFTARKDRKRRLFSLNQPRERALHQRRFAAEAVSRRAVVVGISKTLDEIDNWGRTATTLTLRYTDTADGGPDFRARYEFPVHLPPRLGAKATVRYLEDNPSDRRVSLDPPELPDLPDDTPQDTPPRGSR
ncbi:hypothetical protein [Kitasatospora sp. NPDC059673]|uniref:hypothetical protein n=1 Tax=Kitasatospora sp. NPDC059673 TaxID=3346901 RepID=UPI0036CC3587